MLFLILLFFSITTYCQSEQEIVVALLANDNIADVNIADQDAFITAIGQVTELVKTEFASIPETQKIALLLTVHKTGNPSYEFYSNPAINEKDKNNFLNKLEA